MLSRVNLEINSAQIAENFLNIKKYAAPAKVMAVLKANAYGIGVKKIADLLVSLGVDMIGVAEINEALELSHLNVPIQILGNLLPHEISDAVRINLVAPLNNYEHACLIDHEAARQGKIIRGALTIDSGMGRLGMVAEDAYEEILKIRELKNIRIVGIYSHFSSAFNKSDGYTAFQIERFKKLYQRLIADNFSFEYVHIGASDAINNFPEISKAPFNMVRSGINLYGYADDNIPDTAMTLKGCVELKTYLSSIRTLKAGSALGYGRMHKLKKDSLVGTIAAGYADGLPLALSNRGYVLINGVLCPVLGRISMDYTTVLLDNVPQVKLGDEVVCIGRQGEYEITLDDWAKFKGTHVYEVLCAIGMRVNRKFI
ncbi:MAG: alanine racemase [Lentisphaeria bacterium]|nr:alanine racemase [Lentisphaeria bacterium]